MSAPAPNASTMPTSRSGQRRQSVSSAPITSEDAASAPQPRASISTQSLGRLSAVEPYGQRLELVDEGGFRERRLARDRHRRVARERLGDQHPQLEPRQRGAEAEVPAARAERLMLGIALYVEAVRILVARLVAVRRRVPNHHLLALADRLAVQLGVARRRAAEVRERREHPQRLLDRGGHE